MPIGLLALVVVVLILHLGGAIIDEFWSAEDKGEDSTDSEEGPFGRLRDWWSGLHSRIS